jgi:sigma-B regulation protein RsbU (phosphoserine phosphatase)
MDEQNITILLVEEAGEFSRQVAGMLETAKGVRCDIRPVHSWKEGQERLRNGGIDILLLDIALIDGEWKTSFDGVRSQAQQVPIILLSTLDDETVAVEAVHHGAQDYLVKSELDQEILVRSIRYAIERKHSEMALLRAEEKYRSIFEHITEGIFQTTPEGRYLSANPALAAIYGYASAEDLMKGMTDIGHQLYVDAGRRPEFVRRMEESDVVSGFESRVYRKDGSIIWITENVRAVRGADGTVQCYEGTVEDITERKRAEEEVRNSETLYHSLVETLPQNIFRKDLHERFTFANQRFCQTLGRKLDEILGKTDFDFFPPDLAAKYQRDDRVIMETGKMMEVVEEHQPPGGEKLYVDVVKTPLRDSQGNIIGLQGIFWDITEKKRAEENLRKATLELARSRQELEAKNEQLQDDLKMAREIQQAIIPQQYPCFPRSSGPDGSALRFCHRYLPTGAVGGDFFSVSALADTKAGIFICDVMGHGVRSALVTAIVRTLVEELTPIAANPGQLLGQINRELRSILKQSGSLMFTTAFYAVIDLEARTLIYSNAGHPKPLLIHGAIGEVETLPNPGGAGTPALGLFDGSTYATGQCDLRVGDVLMLFTDGLYDVDGPRQDEYDVDWLVTEVRRRSHLAASALFDELLDELKQASPEGLLADDVCLVGVEVMR